MPEMYFRVRWPDGSVERCYSPSTVVADFFEPGSTYPVPEFVKRSRRALGIASERVRAKFGVACTGASAQLARIEDSAAAFTSPSAHVTVEALLPRDGSAR